MDHVPDTELFSAYLDGELTADEQARVEQILAASAEARQLCEELRALGSTLQALPQEKLDENLSARVLQAAERRMLLPDDAAKKPSAGRAAETLKGPAADAGWIPWREISWRGMLSRRALAWTGVIVAVAIVISFTSPPPPKPNQDVAKVDDSMNRRDEPAGGAPVAAVDKRDKDSASEGWRAPAGESPRRELDRKLVRNAVGDTKEDKGREEQTAAGIVGKSGDRGHDGELNHDLALQNGAGSPRAAYRQRKAGETAKRASENEKADRDGSRLDENAARSEKAKAVPAERLAKNEAAIAATSPAAPAALAPTQPGLALAQETKPAAAPCPPAAPKDKNADRSVAYGAGGLGAKGGKDALKDVRVAANRGKGSGCADQVVNGANAVANAGRPPGAIDRKQVDQAARAGRFPPAITYVHLDVSSAAVRNRVFENLLAQNGLGEDQDSVDEAMFGSPGSFQMEQKIQDAGQGGNTQPYLAANLGAPKGDASRPVPQKPAPSGSMNEGQQAVSQALLAAQNRDHQEVKREGNFQTAGANSPRKAALGKGLPLQLSYRIDAHPEQIAALIRQIHARPDAFSVAGTEPAVRILRGTVQRPESSFGSNGLAEKRAQGLPRQQPANDDAGGTGQSRGEPRPPKAVAAKGATAPAVKRQVVFILTVVDRLPPAATKPAKP